MIRYRSLGVFEEAPFRVHLYVVEDWQGTPTNCSPEHTAIEWHDPKELEALPLASARFAQIFAGMTR